jgi:ketohexokinase
LTIPPRQALRPPPTLLAPVLGVGIATLDIVNEVATYPPEDTEVRALAQRQVRGGNVTNTLAVLHQLGRFCAWAGTLADDPASRQVLADLQAQGIDTSRAVRHPGAYTPVSYITLSRANGSRTIVHHRDLPELTAAAFAETCEAQGWGPWSWVHFEGRAPAETRAMLRLVRERLPGVPISLELEKPRPEAEALLEGPDLLLFSRAYVQAQGIRDPEAFLRRLARATRARYCVLAWGAGGSYGWTPGADMVHAPAEPPKRLVDTLGAGDVFNAAIIDGLLSGLALPEVLVAANRLAGHKCGRLGLAGLVAEGPAMADPSPGGVNPKH